MFLILAGIAAAVIVLILGLRFYRSIDWDEPAEAGGPDVQAMRKRQAELQHIQDVLTEACSQGKLSKNLLAEYNRFCEAEIETMQNAETAWKNRRKNLPKEPS